MPRQSRTLRRSFRRDLERDHEAGSDRPGAVPANTAARLEQAVAAHRAALEEWTRERDPLDWAASLGNQGVALMLIADRTNDVVVAETAVRQIETA